MCVCAVRGRSYISKPKINQVKLTCVPAVNHGVNLRLTTRNEICERRRTYILEIRFVLNFRAILPNRKLLTEFTYCIVQRLSKIRKKTNREIIFHQKKINLKFDGSTYFMYTIDFTYFINQLFVYLFSRS